jgi:hypothetical protein
MIAYIVCEGDLDAQLLQRLLPEGLMQEIEVVSAGGVSAVKSLSRSLIVRRQVPVAIVVDADSVDPKVVQERRENLVEIVESVSVNTPVKVILAIPAMETIFFQDSDLLARLLGFQPAQAILNLAISQPCQALAQLLAQSLTHHNQSQLINQFTHADLKILRKAPVMQEIIHFLQSVQETAKVS